MEQYQEVCRITKSVPNYTCIFLDFVICEKSAKNEKMQFGFCLDLVLVRFQCFCEMALTLSLLISGDFCRLLITYLNSLDPDQD